LDRRFARALRASGPGRCALAAALSEAGGRACARPTLQAQNCQAQVNETTDRDRSRSPQGRCNRRTRTLESAPSGRRRAVAARRCSRRRHARPIQHLDAHPHQSRTCAGRSAACSGAARSGREDLLQFVRLRDFELIVAAVLRLLVGPPAQEDRGMSEAIALHVVVLYFADTLDPQRLPRQILARTPATLAAGHAAGLGSGASPLAPRVIIHRILLQRSELVSELLAHCHRERRGDTDVLQRAAVVIQTEQQRTHNILAGLVPAKAGDDALCGARVLDLDHRALVRLIRTRCRFCDHAVQASAFESRQPVVRDRAISRDGCQVNWRLHLGEQLLEGSTARRLRLAHQVFPTDLQDIERNERRWRFLRELGNTRGRGMQSQLQDVEVEPVLGHDHDLAVDDAVLRQTLQQHVVQLREITIERPRIAALDVHVVLAAEHDRPEAVPLRFIQVVARRQLVREFRKHRFDGWLHDSRLPGGHQLYRALMAAVTEHYATHLGPVYAWMAGGVEAAIARGAKEIETLGLLPRLTGQAVDLGAGFGMHSIPLARRGFSVLAIDSCGELLQTLRQEAGDLPIRTVEGDLLAFGRHLDGLSEIVLCMGDTLTHLPDFATVNAL